MLYQFLEKHRKEILALKEEKTIQLAGTLLSSQELRSGLPLFFENLISFLKNPKEEDPEKKILLSAAQHGKELLRLNYSLSHVVHAYGAMCQSITEFAEHAQLKITSKEFNELNLCLDIAIASAVSEYQFLSVHANEEREIQHMGFLVHELRNALSSASIAQEMIKQGLVGTNGSTARVLEDNLARMRNLIDRSLSELRMRMAPEVHLEKFQLRVLIDQILLTAQSDARTKHQILENTTERNIEMETDRQLLMSAIANLIQNALKYSKDYGRIFIKATDLNQTVNIVIVDECGGIKPELLANLFKPFTSGESDLSGLGLGLTITQRAIHLLHGTIAVTNNHGTGCIFTVTLPQNTPGPRPIIKTVSGAKSVQPEIKIKN